jgi:long-chain fatty acid transport protein
MKKLSLVLIVAVLIPASIMAGGIVTNTNQSASFIRMPSRDASLGLDATYFNPAGLVFLKDGFHLSLNNQTISQTRTIASTFVMNRQEFEGKVSAPLFPTIFAVYKKGNVAYSLGIMPIGGGGSAGFETGLPSFEQQVAVLPGLLSASGINTTQYDVNAKFDGSSLNWGVQFNAAYALNDMFSLSIGARIVTAKNTYEGYLKDVKINPLHPLNPSGAGNITSAPIFFTTLAGAATTAANNLQPLVTGGAGGLTLSQAVGAAIIDAATAAQIAGGLGVSDYTLLPSTIGEIQTIYQTNAATMTYYSGATSDKELKAEQSGMGISPIIGVNIKLMDNFNVALKYEHLTEITMTNKTDRDDVNMYPDGAKTPNDMPGMFSIGAAYKPIEKLNVSAGFHLYLDKGANFGKKIGGSFVDNKEVIDKNLWEAAFGVEYEINDKILFSAGYLRTQTGVNDKYHSDLSHSLSTNSIGLGGKYMVMENLGVNLGFMTTMYEGYTKIFTGYEETYNRKAMVIAIGFDYSF